ncbi:hypothetical protein GCM10007913_11730 [Devosia yakushimensis]|uniref:Uncharacterized protein n=1 Tax=Devosia yakushimensis TaxID=470028 RepID=A0ABQ5UBL8_9HYPH|nr:hypothetical protein [Devosia yakushimensis]GLQ09241.1 hypothetical protein GCM10007913_11730 [Devosia yakushimensis]
MNTSLVVGFAVVAVFIAIVAYIGTRPQVVGTGGAQLAGIKTPWHRLSSMPARLAVIGIVALIFAVGWITRYDVTPAAAGDSPGIVYLLDRWTGGVTLCHAQGCKVLR